MKLLTIGFAVYGEFDSVWATLEGIRANHDPMHAKVDLVVVDNAPRRCRRTEATTKSVGGRYYYRPDLNGTSRPRDACFRFSKTPWTAVGDGHIILETGAVDAMLAFAAANEKSKDLIHGPLINDAGQLQSTGWTQPFPPGLWGEWLCSPHARMVWEEAMTRWTHGGNPVPTPREALDKLSPWEIHSMGLGLWMMRTAAWPGFNSHFRSFGGEEGYIHEKVRRLGGKVLLHPSIRWRHKFRDIQGWDANPMPYSWTDADHIRNMIFGHRELGIDPVIIKTSFGKKVDDATWMRLENEAAAKQPFGQIEVRNKLKVAVIWYSNNGAPLKVLDASLASIATAAEQSRHDVSVGLSMWKREPAIPFPPSQVVIHQPDPTRKGHATILAQQKEALYAAMKKWNGELRAFPDIVVFCEHDVLYPPDYFDRMAESFAKSDCKVTTRVVANNDYVGLNATGYLGVKELHQPLHQIAMSYPTFVTNHERAEKDCMVNAAKGEGYWAYLEPDHAADRSHWVIIPPAFAMPSVHINHEGVGGLRRLTSHGEVVYNADSGGMTDHIYWGPHAQYWPHVVMPASTVIVNQADSAGCQTCGVPDYPSMESWIASEVANQTSDFHFHIPKLMELASLCDEVAEVSKWDNKAALVALCASKAKKIYSVSTLSKKLWPALNKLIGNRLDTFIGPETGLEIPEVDLLYIDTNHSVSRVYEELTKYHAKVRRYIVIHCTSTYGSTGDDGQLPGVMGAIRSFLVQQKKWQVVHRVEENHGLVVLSCNDDDVKEEPGIIRKGMNYARALMKHQAAGAPLVNQRVFELRMAECIVCPDRAHDACSACGCPLAKKLTWATEGCGKGYKNPPEALLFHPTTDPNDLEPA